MTLPEREEYERPLVGCAKSVGVAIIAVALLGLACVGALWAAGWGAS